MAAAEARARYTLRAKLRSITTNDRERGCGVRVVVAKDDAASIECVGKPGSWRVRWTGIMTCGHIWTCPTCSEKLRVQRLQRIDAALRNSGGRWQMVTLTIRHAQGMPLATLVDVLMRGIRLLKQGGKMQRLFTQHVSATVRTLEVTHGINGWHPHVHMLLRTSEWSVRDTWAFAERWMKVIAKLAPECEPDCLVGVRWSTPIDASSDVARASYLAKVGCEIAGVAKKGKGLTTWDLALRATEGDDKSCGLWLAFCAATRGRRMIEMDSRACRYAEKQTVFDDAADSARAGERVERIQIFREELAGLRRGERFSPSLLYAITEAMSTAEDPRAAYEEATARYLTAPSTLPAPAQKREAG